MANPLLERLWLCPTQLEAAPLYFQHLALNVAHQLSVLLENQHVVQTAATDQSTLVDALAPSFSYHTSNYRQGSLVGSDRLGTGHEWHHLVEVHFDTS